VIYLADTSALSRIYRRQVEQQWHESVEHGLVAICEPVLAEVLTIAEAG
jgi:predicted nucleic acid-binding protein